MIKLSIIIPMYNVEDYIIETLQSILRQNCEKIEILCVNDGSTDQTVERVQEYRKHYSLIRLINQSNKGVAAARNRGISESKGEYIFFLDGDDLMEPQFINYFMESNLSVDLVVGNRNYLEEHKKSASNYVDSEFNPHEFLIYSIDNKIIYWNIGGFIVQRSFLLKNTILFLEGCSSAEDLDFFMKILQLCQIVKTVDVPFFSYRRNRQGSAVHTSSLNKIKSQVEIYLKYYYKYSKDNQLRKYFSQAILRSMVQISTLKERKEVIPTKKYIKTFMRTMQHKNFLIKIYGIFCNLFGFYFGSKILIELKHIVKRIYR